MSAAWTFNYLTEAQPKYFQPEWRNTPKQQGDIQCHRDTMCVLTMMLYNDRLSIIETMATNVCNIREVLICLSQTTTFLIDLTV